jgi:hypothetical protein
MTEKKKWYQSKIAGFGILLALVALSNLGWGWAGVNIPADQIDAMRELYPQGVDIVERLKGGESIFSVVGAIFGIIIAVWRIWFTKAEIEKSVT